MTPPRTPLTDPERLRAELMALRSLPHNALEGRAAGALALAERVAAPDSLAEALSYVAAVAHRQRRLGRAFRFAARAEGLATTPRVKAMVAMRLARYHAAVSEQPLAVAHFERAAVLFDQAGQPSEAVNARIDLLNHALRSDPTVDISTVVEEAERLQDLLALHKLGYIRMRGALRRGDLEEAMASCRWQQVRFPDMPERCATAGLNLGVFHLLRGEFAEAEDQAQRALVALPELIEVYVLQARLAARQGERARGEALLNTLLSHKRADAGIRGPLASYIRLCRIGLRACDDAPVLAADLVGLGTTRTPNLPTTLPEGLEARHWAEHTWPQALQHADRWPRFTRLAAYAIEMLDPVETFDTAALRHKLVEARRRGASIPTGPWELDQPVSRGAHGEVWRASHLATGRAAAVKILHLDAPDKLRTEAAAVASLRHPGIVALLDIGALPPVAGSMTEGALRSGAPWMAMELVEGGPLTPHCGRLPWSEVEPVLRTLLDALSHAHARGVLHLDIKPQNVLLDAVGIGRVAKLTDFGLTQRTDGAATPRISGTPAYMSPEQVQGNWRSFGPTTDLYGVGCLAWHLVTGRPPFGYGRFETLRDAHLHSPPPELEPTTAVPEGLERWLLRLIAKEPSERFPSARHASDALAHLLSPAERPDWLPLPASFARVALPVPNPLSGLGLAPPRPPLTGRDEAQSVLWTHLSQVVRDRHAGVVLLQGPEGVGVSAVARWLLERAAEEGVRALRLSGSSGLAEGLQDWMRVDGLEGERRLRRIAVALQLPVTDALVHQVDGALLVGTDLVLAVAAVLLHWAARRPIALEIDDAHRSGWAEPLTERLLEDGAAVLVLLVVRTTDPQDLQPGAVATKVELGPLSDQSISQGLSDVLALSPSLQTRLVGAAAGSIGFALGCVNRWLREGALVDGPDGLELGAGHTLDGTTPEAWTQRFHNVLPNHAERELISLAATLGSPFRPNELRAAAQDLGLVVDSEHALEHLVKQDLLSHAGPGLVRFEVTAAQRALRSESGDFHRACAAAIPVSEPGRRAPHLLRCGEIRSAAVHLLRQAVLDLQRGLHGPAMVALQEFEAAMERMDPEEQDPIWIEAEKAKAELNASRS